ncbi:MAG TPA: hypothetical protein VKK79_22265 [Candidatus Lokiarchaeia archaeon]|nr:hypothetical protein [Candidatus Lokiarchaeia archaeon]
MPRSHKSHKFEPFSTFEQLAGEFEADYFPSAVLGEGTFAERWRKERTFALKFNEYYRAMPGVEVSGFLIPVNLLLAVFLAVLAVLENSLSLLVIGGGTGLLLAIIFLSSRRVIPVIPIRWIPFIPAFFLFFVPLFATHLSFLIFSVLANYCLGNALIDILLKPPSLKGNLCFALLNLEIAAKWDAWSAVRHLPDLFAASLKSLHALLDKFFNMGIANMEEVEAKFNRRLLLEKDAFREHLQFFGDSHLREFLTQRSGILAHPPENWKESSIMETRATGKTQVQKRFEQLYEEVDRLVVAFEDISAPLKIDRLTLRQRLKANAGKIVTVLSAILSGVLAIMEFFLYSEALHLI